MVRHTGDSNVRGQPYTRRAMDPETRYRCASCGNLTRFDVVATRRTRQFLHFSLAGEPSIEEEEVLAEDVESITCRWCNSTDIDIVPKVTSE
jgi:hypothetical protein